MKSLKSLIFTGALIAGLAGSAFANTTQYVYVVGAPAYRQDSNTNLAAYVATFAGGGIRATSGPTSGTSDVTSASYNQWIIPNFSSGVDLEINAAWTGSTAGFESVASGTITQKFIPDNTGTTGSPSVLQTNTEAHQPNFTLSDTFQATTLFNGTKTFYAAAGTGSPFTATYGTLTANPLGVEAYKFVASPGAAAAGLTNISTSQAQALFKNGQLPLAFFTGNNADEGKWVYGLTRDGGSGSRLVAQTEIGLGATATLKTYQPNITGGSVDSAGNQVGGSDTTDNYASVPLAPAEKIPSTGIWAVQGNSGYAKFGTPSGQNGLLLAITSTPPAGAIFVTYLNVADGAEAVQAGSEVLTYNGVPFSSTAVAEGNYSFWSYEQLFAPATISGNAATVASWLESNWTLNTANGGIALGTLNVGKTADGGIITGNYY
jgi:hypothetical protein